MPRMPDDQGVRPLKHGYTNRTVTDGAVVAKTYERPGANSGYGASTDC